MTLRLGVLTMLFRRPVVKRLPLHLQLEVTDACNLHYTTCSRDLLVQKPSILSKPMWNTIIDEMKPTNINVSGIGEPFLHPRIFDVIRYAKAHGAAVNCATKMTRVKGRHREIVESGIDQLKVSIDAVDAETYVTIRVEELRGDLEQREVSGAARGADARLTTDTLVQDLLPAGSYNIISIKSKLLP